MTLVEKIARAVLEADVASTQEDFPDTPPNILRLAAESLFEKHHKPMALAALRAMREPTEGMFVAGGLQLPNNEDDWDAIEPGEIWRAMIDTAIQEAETA